MEIVVIGTRGFPDVLGGIERHCEELYPRLVRLGCRITVFTRTPYIPQDMRRSEWQGIRFIHQWCPRKKSFEAIIHTLLGVLKSRTISPDILHFHAVGPSLLVPLARLSGLKTVMTHHGPDYERAKWGKLAKTVLRQGEKQGVNHSNAIITISKLIQSQVKTKFNREAFFIPNGVTIPSRIAAGKTLAKWQLNPQQYVLTACRFVPEKGLHDLLAAYAKIKDPPFKLVIAGDADHESDYSRRIKQQASEIKGVVLTGFVSGDTLRELFSNAGLFVLPSYYEGLPIALLEALSYGLPVLVSDIPQHKEVALSASRYFPLGDVDALADALTDSCQKGISEQERSCYNSLLNDKYNWDMIAAKTLEVYQTVANK